MRVAKLNSCYKKLTLEYITCNIMVEGCEGVVIKALCHMERSWPYAIIKKSLLVRSRSTPLSLPRLLRDKLWKDRTHTPRPG